MNEAQNENCMRSEYFQRRRLNEKTSGMDDHSAFCTCHLNCLLYLKWKKLANLFLQNTVQKSNHVQVNEIDKNCLKKYNFH